MKRLIRAAAILSAILLFSVESLYAADPTAGTLKCVGLYSETDAGSVSFRIGTGAWVVIKLGDTIPANAEIRVNVDRDWIEVTPSNNPNAVYELAGSETGDVIKKVADILKGKPKLVAFPKGSADKPDPKFKDKLVVTQYLGRQIYMTGDGASNNLKYGDVLDSKGKVNIIGINNPLTLMNAGGAITKIIGPLKFTADQVLNNKSLYKFLNVLK